MKITTRERINTDFITGGYMLNYAKQILAWAVGIIPLDWVVNFIYNLVEKAVKATPTHLDEDGLKILKAVLGKLGVVKTFASPTNDNDIITGAYEVLKDAASLTSTQLDDNAVYMIGITLKQFGVLPANYVIPNPIGMPELSMTDPTINFSPKIYGGILPTLNKID